MIPVSLAMAQTTTHPSSHHEELGRRHEPSLHLPALHLAPDPLSADKEAVHVEETLISGFVLGLGESLPAEATALPQP